MKWEIVKQRKEDWYKRKCLSILIVPFYITHLDEFGFFRERAGRTCSKLYLNRIVNKWFLCNPKFLAKMVQNVNIYHLGPACCLLLLFILIVNICRHRFPSPCSSWTVEVVVVVGRTAAAAWTCHYCHYHNEAYIVCYYFLHRNRCYYFLHRNRKLSPFFWLEITKKYTFFSSRNLAVLPESTNKFSPDRLHGNRMFPFDLNLWCTSPI